MPRSCVQAGLQAVRRAHALTATIRLTDGTTVVVPLVPGGGEGEYIDWGNPGLPDNWGGPWTPEPVFVDDIDVDAPRKTLTLAPFMGVPQPLGGPWQLVQTTDYHYKNKRSGHAAVYDSSTGHVIDGGVRKLPFRFVPADDPLELRLLANVTPERYAKALAVLDLNQARIAKYPQLAKVLNWFVYDATSPVKTTPPGKRNEGFLINPETFIYRWAGHPGGIAAAKHWYGFGTKQAGVSLNNEHYALDAAWLRAGMGGNAVSMTIGLYLLRHKIAFGLIDCDAPCAHKGMWRNETGNELRGTAGIAPSHAKEWDLGLVLANILLPEDTLIARAYKVRFDYLAKARNTWAGSGGARNLGRFLQNLKHFYIASGDDLFKTSAEAAINKAFTAIGNRNYMPNTASGSTNESCHDEGTYQSIAWWIAKGICQNHEPQLKKIVEHALTHCVAASGQYGYKWNPTPNVGTVVSEVTHAVLQPYEVAYSGKFQGVSIVGLRPFAEKWWPGRFTATFDKIEDFVFRAYENDATYDAAFGAEGPGFQKWKGFLFHDGARNL